VDSAGQAASVRPQRQQSAATSEVSPAIERIAAAVEETLDRVAVAAVEAIWEQVPAYSSSGHERLRDDVTAHVETVFRAWLTALKEQRPAQRADFPMTRDQATARINQGISLADFLKAFQVGQHTLWENVWQIVRDDPAAWEAALSVVGPIMQVIEVGSTVAAEAYLEAQQHQLADTDRVRRDLLEDLLNRRTPAPGSKQAMLRSAGLEASLLVVSAAPVSYSGDDRALRDAAAGLRRAWGGGTGLAVVRQEEVVAVLPITRGRAKAAVANLRLIFADLERQRVRLAVGVSTVRTGLPEVPEAYSEACAARSGLGAEPGVLALPSLSSFDYLVLREDETARRLIRPEVRRFIEEDAAAGGALIATLITYAACDLNAKTAAKRLHVHANTAYYRLERVAERTGCDLRRLTDVVELLVAVRLLGANRPPAAAS
jgi:sugar diacid utilization regulator